ncbi:unnamed protein product [Callosobruchus maculatus]|uniref:Uncharacterized protein n=1 Tax=Callosobruchus maculatus TaxID=64391 RepID=A0A653C1W7_CALMS|nr:unnamed protein product [Callosobruchus maculatus]
MPTFQLGDIREYESLACEIEMHVRKLLEEHNYDTVGNFLAFYDAFKKSGCANVLEFFRMYTPPITPDHYTCVGLALELWHRLGIQLESKYPGIGDYLCVVSCEEDIDSTPMYTAQSHRLESTYKLEKEHVLLCLKVQFSGRTGVLLCDPGYHVSRVITIMNDNNYPHTGWYIQAEDDDVCKEYCYHLSSTNPNFVEWDERTTRKGKQECFTGLIYVGRPYQTAVDVTERRNLVYCFRSLLSRDQKGNLIAGIYFKVKKNGDEFTMFFQSMGKQRIKMKFSDFLQAEINKEQLDKLSVCNDQLNLPKNKLLSIVQQAGQILRDEEFIQQTLDIDRCINLVSADN